MIYEIAERVLWTLPSCNGSIVCIISCSKPWRNFAPVAVCAVLLPGALPLDPGAPERLSDAARDVTEPPGCVAIDVSDEFAALPFRFRKVVSKQLEKESKKEEKNILKRIHEEVKTFAFSPTRNQLLNLSLKKMPSMRI